MSGGKVAYHLRPNKAVDRQLFLELLARVDSVKPIKNYAYVGLGGPFLEDFRLIHSQFGITRMTSLEMTPEVFDRQKFNRPLKCIKLEFLKTGEFIASYVSTRNAIFWLDYASPKNLREQLGEFELLLAKLIHGDVVKITLNANPDAVAPVQPPPGEVLTKEQLRPLRLEKLKQKIQEYLPDTIAPDDMAPDALPGVLLNAIQYAHARALNASPDLSFLMLSAFVYNDAFHNMLTATGVVLRTTEHAAFLKGSGIDKWDLGLPHGKAPIEIAVPALSVRERLLIDQKLPGSSPESIVKKLGFLLGKDAQASANQITAYARFYRHYPVYSRIVP